MSHSSQKLKVIANALPQSQEEVIARLLADFDELPGQLQLCARYLIDHPHEVGLQSMRTLAANAEVQPNSFVRLARHLGFEGYDAMRERFRDFVRGGTGSTPDRVRWLQQMDREGGSAAIFGSMAEACLENTEKMFAQQSVADLERAADLMINARRVYVLGLGLAYPLAYNFWYVARMGFDHFILTPRHGSPVIRQRLSPFLRLLGELVRGGTHPQGQLCCNLLQVLYIRAQRGTLVFQFRLLLH